MERLVDVKERKITIALRTVLTAGIIASLLAVSGGTVSAGTVTSESAETDACIEMDYTETTEDTLVLDSVYSEEQLYSQAAPLSYNGSYRSELLGDEIALAVYDKYYANYAAVSGKGRFTIELDPHIFVVGVDNGRTDDQGYSMIDPDDNDQNYQDFSSSVNRGKFAFLYDHPEVFWTKSSLTSTYYYQREVDSGYELEIVKFSVIPQESYSGAYDQLDIVRNGINAAQNAIAVGSDRFGTLKNIHDYVCNNLVYDSYEAENGGNQESHTAAPLFNGTGTCVCEGYSKSFKVLCDRFGIPCVLVCGTANLGDSIDGHMWNYVQMEDGMWYAVDVTWDDTNSGIIYNYFLKGSNSFSSAHTPSNPGGVYTDGTKFEVEINYPCLSTNDYYYNFNQSEDVPESLDEPEVSVSGTEPSRPVRLRSPDRTSAETTTASNSDSEATTASNDVSETTAPSTVATTTANVTSATQSIKEVEIRLGDPDNGFVKSAVFSQDARTKVGGEYIELEKVKINVKKLNDAEKKSLSDGIRNIDGSFENDNSFLEEYDIELSDNYGRTVTMEQGNVRLCLAFPASIAGKDGDCEYSVYHQKSDGTVERMKNVICDERGVWFESNKFSPFALVSEKKNDDMSLRLTADTILVAVIAGILLVLAIFVTIIVRIRERRIRIQSEFFLN